MSPKVGAITKKLRNMASPTITWLGGIVWSPRALRVSDSTITMRVKLVSMMSSAGATDSSVMSTMIIRLWLGLPPTPPRSRLSDAFVSVLPAGAPAVVVPVAGAPLTTAAAARSLAGAVVVVVVVGRPAVPFRPDRAVVGGVGAGAVVVVVGGSGSGWSVVAVGSGTAWTVVVVVSGIDSAVVVVVSGTASAVVVVVSGADGSAGPSTTWAATRAAPSGPADAGGAAPSGQAKEMSPHAARARRPREVGITASPSGGVQDRRTVRSRSCSRATFHGREPGPIPGPAGPGAVGGSR